MQHKIAPMSAQLPDHLPVPPRAVIVGCGYVGLRLGRLLADERETLGIVSSAASVARVRAAGLKVQAIDLDAPGPDRLLEGAKDADLYYLVPPPPDGDSDPRLGRFLNRLAGRPRVFIYMSTTGVYGDGGGEEVTEATPVSPLTARARRRVNAEDMVRTWCTENEVRRVVLRVPGIYGPGRLPLARLATREPAIRIEEAGMGNRIHVDDLAAACIAAAGEPQARGVYNITDGNPLNTTAFLLRVAALSGLPPPPQIPMDEAQLVLSAARLSFLNESRRVANGRMLAELGIKLNYADVDAGIRQSLLEMG